MNYKVGFICDRTDPGMEYVGDVLTCEVLSGNRTIGWSGTLGTCEGIVLVFKKAMVIHYVFSIFLGILECRV